MKKSDSDLAAFGTLANHELVVLAAYLVGAGSASADTEDIAMKANQLAPGRFSWRRYKDQINIESVRKRAAVDLNCSEAIQVDVLEVGNSWRPWTFAAAGCGQRASYLSRMGTLMRN